MKKETIATAVIFLVVGFLAGYITDAQLNWNGRQKATQTGMEAPAGGATSALAGRAMPSGLPEGHPLLTARPSSSRWKTWRRRTRRTLRFG